MTWPFGNAHLTYEHHIHMKRLSIFESLSSLISAIGQESFSNNLSRFVNSIAKSDSSIVFVYRYNSPPEILFERSAHPLRKNSLENYIEGFYLLDPFYRAAIHENKRGVIRIESIEPSGFRDSEYFCQYYKHAHAEDELNIIIRVAPDAVLAASFERAEGKGRYRPEEVSLLTDLEPTLRSATESHWRWSSTVKHQENSAKAAHLHFTNVINEFGKEELTPREREIVQLVLRGYSTMEIARLNRISEDTVKVHRRNIYEKLQISSLSQLFSRVLNDLGATSSSPSSTEKDRS